jgi:hypothetical protein
VQLSEAGIGAAQRLGRGLPKHTPRADGDRSDQHQDHDVFDRRQTPLAPALPQAPN